MGEPWPEPQPGEWQVLDAGGNVVDHGPVPQMQAVAAAGDDDGKDGE
jgi:hypothetical protein